MQCLARRELWRISFRIAKAETSHNLFLSIFILVVSRLTLPSLTLHSLSLPSSFSSLTLTSLSLPSNFSSFPNGWAHELAEQDELLTTFGEQELVKNELSRTGWVNEIEKQHELLKLLWDQEFEKHLADKPFSMISFRNTIRTSSSKISLKRTMLGHFSISKIFPRMRRTRRRKNNLRPKMSFTRVSRK